MSTEDIVIGGLLLVGAIIAAAVYVSFGALTAWAIGFPEWSVTWLACVFGWPLIVGLVLWLLQMIFPVLTIIVASAFALFTWITLAIVEWRR